MEKVRMGLVGCGKVARTHARALSTLPEADLRGVCDIDVGRARAFADEYGARAFGTVPEMVEQAGVEAVVVCTPHPVHAAPAVQAAQCGAHVLIEKPLASTLKDCDAILSAAAEGDVKVGVVSQRRLYEPVRRVKAAIEAGKIGEPVLGTVTMLGWRDRAYYESDPWRGKWVEEGGGVLVNQSPHQLDLLQWFMGPIDALFGYWENLNHPYIEVEDTAIAVLRFKSGALGSILVSNSQKPGIYGKVHVHGSSGSSVGVQTDGGAMFIAGMSEVLEPPVNDLWTVPGEERLLARWQEEDRVTFEAVDATSHYHRLQDRDFVQAILQDRDPMVTGAQGRVTVEIFTAIYRSQRDGKPIEFPLDAEAGSSEFDGRLSRRR
jgi:predicted dehydrogenase